MDLPATGSCTAAEKYTGTNFAPDCLVGRWMLWSHAAYAESDLRFFCSHHQSHLRTRIRNYLTLHVNREIKNYFKIDHFDKKKNFP
ncbi:hypothetical protein BpHYR1_046261 [Brachionus plicatilis]|uniref:Uncharacterized protein n=1 Tax=Brachionus plicatilis TaxID=10195 RepID=A0A3M7S5K3_BRAPC|nr:hypothetical protein BpHYR1_046261 [Brachionus plicatilis]